ncbi:uncharacterized protein PgNI_09352 [Pyricularia grisea]|uniref:Uncharacterized protein n=1 Tax=Pyricularia grisea TaxID=148305 RepID=A0A6P8ARF3_PYRGI|nr:uncharacterized protein PgNI_09352 [Pyricularia grisea]TLD04685.1 hypothetical protein PgNI_09352 [Pyricularia grisea]
MAKRLRFTLGWESPSNSNTQEEVAFALVSKLKEAWWRLPGWRRSGVGVECPGSVMACRKSYHGTHCR